ncbi:hypothetical protein BH10ACT7_BH10ACT7_22950 [soil metagenome]
MTQPSAAPVRERRTWDLVLTIVLLVLYLAGNVILSALALFFLAFAGDSCGARNTCDYDQISNGILIATAGPWIPVIFVVAGAIILLVIKRIAFWVPLVGGALSVTALVVGIAIATSAASA